MYSTNSHDGQVTQHGGLTRISHGAPAQDELARRVEEEPQPARVGGTYVRANSRTGEVETLPSFASHTHTPDRPNPSGSVMQSMRMEGASRTVELVPGEPSSRTLLSVAIREGLVVETAPGVYTDRNAPQQGTTATNEAPQANDKPASTDPLDGTVFDKGEYAIWAAETAGIPDHHYDRAVAGVTAALSTANPEKLEGVVMTLAQAEGMEPDAARELVDTGVEWFAAALSKDLQKTLGMTTEQVDGLYDQFRERPHPRLAEAIQQLAVFGRSDVFREIALAYKVQSAVGTDMSAFHKAGYESRVDRATGEILVRRGQGNWTPLNDLQGRGGEQKAPKREAQQAPQEGQRAARFEAELKRLILNGYQFTPDGAYASRGGSEWQLVSDLIRR